jgi:hypothetical protein
MDIRGDHSTCQNNSPKGIQLTPKQHGKVPSILWEVYWPLPLFLFTFFPVSSQALGVSECVSAGCGKAGSHHVNISLRTETLEVKWRLSPLKVTCLCEALLLLCCFGCLKSISICDDPISEMTMVKDYKSLGCVVPVMEHTQDSVLCKYQELWNIKQNRPFNVRNWLGEKSEKNHPAPLSDAVLLPNLYFTLLIFKLFFGRMIYFPHYC